MNENPKILCYKNRTFPLLNECNHQRCGFNQQIHGDLTPKYGDFININGAMMGI
jgi:hypothetical protein